MSSANIGHQKKRHQRLRDSLVPVATTSRTPQSKAISMLSESGILAENVPDLRREQVTKTLTFHNAIMPIIKPLLKRNKGSVALLKRNIAKYKLLHFASHSLGYASTLRQVQNKIRSTSKLQRAITEFFLCDDVSRATAGVKETVTRNKIKKQKRYILQSMKKLHIKFCSTFNKKISYSCFVKNRPFFVVAKKDSDRDTCLCRIHSNIDMKVKALLKQKLLNNTDTHQIASEIVCNRRSYACMNNICKQCKDRQYPIATAYDKNMKIQWKEWKNVTEQRAKNNKIFSVKIVKKMTVEESLKNLLATFNRDLINFKRHIFNIKVQNAAYNKCIQSLSEKSALVHIDFSENFNCKLSSEIQAYHFGASRLQVTLHTGMLYRSGQEPMSFCTISPSMYHGPEAIWAHLDPILKLISSEPQVELVHFFSDGPSTQYRQKTNFYLLTSRFYSYGFKTATWSFFESSHGKGAPDGVGGALKRSANQLVAYGTDIPDAQTFYNVMKENSKVHLFYITQTMIDDIKKLIPREILPIKGTTKLHQLTLSKHSTLLYRDVSCYCKDNLWISSQYCHCHSLFKEHILIKDINSLKNIDRISPEVVSSDSELEDVPVDDCDSVDLEELELDENEMNLPNLHEVEIDKIKTGTNVLVKFTGGAQPKRHHIKKGRNKTEYRYAGLCQGPVDDEEGDVPVMFYAVVGEDASLFRLKRDKIADVPFEHVLGILPNPTRTVKGVREYWKFPSRVDIYES